MAVNMLLLSEFEYRRGLAKRLLEEKVVNFCLVERYPWTKYPEHDDRIVEFDCRIKSDLEYCELLDLNELPPISKDLMESMLPYESTAVKMYERINGDAPISNYFDGKRRYLQHLRYWNYMLDRYEINLIVIPIIPHSMGSYVVYALSRIKKIPVLIWHRIGFFRNLCLWGNSINGLGDRVASYFEELQNNKTNDEEYELNRYITDECESYLYRKDIDNKQDYSIGNSLRLLYSSKFKARKKEHYRKFFRYIGKSLIKERKVPTWYDERIGVFRTERRWIKTYHYYIRHDVAYRRHYDKICDMVDYDDPFIVFFLQVSPEASTLPTAGVFEEQYNSIWLLASVGARLGVKIFVREHPEGGRRAKDFYALLKGIPNVKLIDNKETSNYVMQKSMCVATQTGTCIIESLLLRKPVIAVGDGYFYKGRPGLFEVDDEESAVKAITTIQEGVLITDQDVKKYLYALQKESMEDVDYSEEEKMKQDPNPDVPSFILDKRVALIKRFIGESGLI